MGQLPSEEQGEADGRRPSIRTGLARIEVAGHTILASERVQHPASLDQVATVLWDSFDGSTTVAELTSDLVEALGGDPQERTKQVQELVRVLTLGGFLDDPLQRGPVIPHRPIPRLDPTSCLGRKLGLGRAVTIQVRAEDGSEFRVASTVPALIEPLSSTLSTVPIDDRALETFVLRATISPSGRPRVQQLFDTIGNPLWAGRDIEAAKEALHRLVGARLTVDKGVWVQGVAVASDAAVVLIHASLRDHIVDVMRRDIEARGLCLLPAGLLQIEDGWQTRNAPDPVTGAPGSTYRLAGVLSVAAKTEVGRFRRTVEIARRWDQPHLERIRDLVDAGLVIELDSTEGHNSPIDAISRALTG